MYKPLVRSNLSYYDMLKETTYCCFYFSPSNFFLFILFKHRDGTEKVFTVPPRVEKPNKSMPTHLLTCVNKTSCI
uniref:Uncharacterized protein n=1 Tax=Oryza brachyantha TaxID=4533 RepID=J3KV09_ORYBR